MSDTPPLFEASLHKPMMDQALGCLASIPLIFAVVVVVNLFIGDDALPPEIRGTTIYFAVATVIMGAVAVVFWYRNRIRMAVVERAGVRYLEIYDPAGPLVLQGPFEVRYGYTQLHMPKTGTQTIVIVGIYLDGALEVSFSEMLGSAYAPPEGWTPDFSLTGMAKASYVPAMGTLFCQELVRVLE